MKLNPEIKALFPEKTDHQILDMVINFCDDCDYRAVSGSCACENYCALGRLWKLYEEKKNEKTH